MNKTILGAHLNLLLWTFIVGLSFPAVSMLSKGLPPILLTSFRFAVAILSIAPFLKGKTDVKPSRKGFALYTLMALCLALFFCGMFWAAERATSLSMATLYVSVPLLAYLFGRLLSVERADLKMLVVLLTGAVGALLLAFIDAGRVHGGISFGKGEAVFFVGCIASALYPVLTKAGLQKGLLSSSALVRTFWSLLLGSLLMALAGLLFEAPAELLRMNLRDVLLIVYLGIFSSGLTFWLMQYATAILTPAAVTAYSYLVPFVSMVFLFVENPTQLSLKWLPGSLLVAAAIIQLFRDDLNKRRYMN